MTTLPLATAFLGPRRIAAGRLDQVALTLYRREKPVAEPAPLAFDDHTGTVIDLDLRGPEEAILGRLQASYPDAPGGGIPRGPGRPKLGVVAREVTLLPNHWEWLARQRGGASAALRRLVDEARRAGGVEDGRRIAEERTYRFIHAVGGDLPGYEESTRALFAHDATGFAERIAGWPPDIREHALRLLREPG